MKKEPLIILTGPTAVGKTELSIELAKAVNGEIISADSMQVYRYMDIGTAKITKEEMQGVKHYLVDEIEPTDGFDVARFKTMAVDAISISSLLIPLPLSVTLINEIPPSFISTVIAVAPASIAFSTSSLTTEEGLSTTSPAAILLIVFWSKSVIDIQSSLFYQRFLAFPCSL
jgi:hypothetical protein